MDGVYVAPAHFWGPESTPMNREDWSINAEITNASPDPNPPQRSSGPTPGQKIVLSSGRGDLRSQPRLMGRWPNPLTRSPPVMWLVGSKFFFWAAVFP